MNNVVVAAVQIACTDDLEENLAKIERYVIAAAKPGAKLSKKRLKRGVFGSVVELQEAINRFVAETNHNPKPFVWTADPDRIIAAVWRGHHVLDSIH